MSSEEELKKYAEKIAEAKPIASEEELKRACKGVK